MRAEKNPSQAKAVKKFNELKKLKKQKPVPETRPTNIKQSYVRQKTKTKCLASDVTVLGDKYDDCKTKLKKATKRIRVSSL